MLHGLFFQGLWCYQRSVPFCDFHFEEHIFVSPNGLEASLSRILSPDTTVISVSRLLRKSLCAAVLTAFGQFAGLYLQTEVQVGRSRLKHIL
jgi:hypothetical protein